MVPERSPLAERAAGVAANASVVVGVLAVFAAADWILATIPAFGLGAAVPAMLPVLGGSLLVGGGVDFEYRHRAALPMFVSGWGLIAAWVVLTARG